MGIRDSRDGIKGVIFLEELNGACAEKRVEEGGFIMLIGLREVEWCGQKGKRIKIGDEGKHDGRGEGWILDTLKMNSWFGVTLTIFFTTVHDLQFVRNLQGQDKVIEEGVAATVIKYPSSSFI